jgi:hypothetical protein
LVHHCISGGFLVKNVFIACIVSVLPVYFVVFYEVVYETKEKG